MQIQLIFILLFLFTHSSLNAGLKPEKLKETISTFNNHSQLSVNKISEFKHQHLKRKKKKETQRQLISFENQILQFVSEGVKNRRGMLSEEKEFLMYGKKIFKIQENIPKMDLKNLQIFNVTLNNKRWIYITGPGLGLLNEGKLLSLNVNHLIELVENEPVQLISFINHYLDIDSLGVLNGKLSVFLFQSKYPENQKTAIEGGKFIVESTGLIKDSSSFVKYTLDELYYR